MDLLYRVLPFYAVLIFGVLATLVICIRLIVVVLRTTEAARRTAVVRDAASLRIRTLGLRLLSIAVANMLCFTPLLIYRIHGWTSSDAYNDNLMFAVCLTMPLHGFVDALLLAWTMPSYRRQVRKASVRAAELSGGWTTADGAVRGV